MLYVSEYIMDAFGIDGICCMHNFSSNWTRNRERLLLYEGSTTELTIKGNFNAKFNFGSGVKY